jgi:hypothetical protein
MIRFLIAAENPCMAQDSRMANFFAHCFVYGLFSGDLWSAFV